MLLRPLEVLSLLRPGGFGEYPHLVLRTAYLTGAVIADRQSQTCLTSRREQKHL